MQEISERRSVLQTASARFADYLARVGIIWPRYETTNKLDMRSKTFDSMAKAWPQLEPLRQLRHVGSLEVAFQRTFGN